MSKQEFLDGLRRSLAGGMDSGEVNEHIKYYSDYIDSQIRRGNLEEEVMASLGEPRLIAKTLLGLEGVETVAEEYVEDGPGKEQDYRYFNFNGKSFRIPGWLFTILVCVISFCVLTLLFALLSRLLPIFLMIMFGVVMYRFLRNIFR